MSVCIKCKRSIPLDYPFCPECEALQVISPQEISPAAIKWCEDGYSLLETGEYAKAVGNFTYAINADDSYVDAYSGRAKAYQELNQTINAAVDEAKAKSKLQVVRLNGVRGMSLEDVSLELNRGARFIRYKKCLSYLLESASYESDPQFLTANESRLKRGIPFSLFSLLAGIWGIPWGPLFILEAIFRNTLGGRDVTDDVVLAISLVRDVND